MSLLSVRVYGDPVAQGRPRAALIAGHVRVYDPATSRDWKRTVAAQVIAARSGSKPLAGALSVRLTFYLRRPASVSAKKRPYPTVRPDVENCSKAVCDACRGILYLDDAQIIELHLRKEYGDRPGVQIEVSDLTTAS